MFPRAFWHYLAAFYFAVQSLGATIWWLALLLEPRVRPWFRPSGTPDSALLSFGLADAVLFIGAALWAAFWLVKRPVKARVPLALHLGGAGYAALYCVLQTLLTGEGVAAAVLMTLCVTCGAFLGWKAAFSGD